MAILHGHRIAPLAAAISILISFSPQAATINWIGTSGYWDDTTQWGTLAPGINDNAVINVPGAQTVTVRTGNNIINSLSVSSSNQLAIVGGTLSIAANSSLGNFYQSAGTLTTAGDLNINGTGYWSGGTQNGAGRTVVNGALSISTSGEKFLDGRALVNNGTAHWNSPSYSNYYASYPAYLNLSNGASIENNGTWLDEVSSTSNSNYQFMRNTGNAGAFINNGTYTKSGTGTSYIGVAFNNANTGVLNVNAGNLYLHGGGVSNAGTISVATNAVLSVQSPTFINQGIVEGNGAIQTRDANTALVNDGVLAPGINGIGTLTVIGDYAQTSSGILDVQLSSLSSFDKLNVLGDVSLSGTLRIHGLDNYNPIIGSSFTIATFDDGLADYSDLTGVFNNIIWSGFNTNLAFTASYFDHSIVLNAVTAPVPLPAAGWLFGSGMIGIFGFSSRKRLVA